MKLVELPWDSSFFGLRVAKLDLSQIGVTLKKDFAQFDYVRARVPTTDTGLLNRLERIGFRIYDTLVYLELKFDHMNGKKGYSGTFCRWYEKKDIPKMREIARSSFAYDHHHQDPKFDRKKVDEMHALWVDKCVREKYDIDVAEYEGKITGFITTKNKDDSCYIELVAVDEKLRGKGIAEDLTMFALTRAAFQVPRATVETQIANVPAVRLYEKLGFRLVKSEHTLHWHRQ